MTNPTRETPDRKPWGWKEYTLLLLGALLLLLVLWLAGLLGAP